MVLSGPPWSAQRSVMIKGSIVYSVHVPNIKQTQTRLRVKFILSVHQQQSEIYGKLHIVYSRKLSYTEAKFLQTFTEIVSLHNLQAGISHTIVLLH